MGFVRMEVKILAEIAEDEIGKPVAIEIGCRHAGPPSMEVFQVCRDFFEMVVSPGKDAGSHPVACDDELFGRIAFDIGISGGSDHADAGDVGIPRWGDIGKMTMAVVHENGAGGRDAVFLRDASSADEKIGISIMVEISGDSHAGIDAIEIAWKRIDVNGKIAFAVVLIETQLH